MTCRIAFRGCLTALAALMMLTPATAREIKGELAYRERIALPEGAVFTVEVREGARPLAALRSLVRGAQVPVPFAMVAPGGEGQVLTGVILVEGLPRWISAPMPLAAGDGPVDLGMVALSALTPAFPSRLICGDREAGVGLAGPETAVLTLGPETFRLTSVADASGARFSDGASPETAVRLEGARARITLRGTDLPECTPMQETLPLPFVARGNEPGWVLNVSGEGVALSREDGGGASGGPLPAGEESEAGTRYAVGPDLAFTVQPDLCRDTMTGMPYPQTVLVEQAGALLSGCGGDPKALLAGDWRVTRIGETDVPAGVETTMAFEAGRVAGKSGCNRYTGAVTLTGEALMLGPVAGTRMACMGEAASVEQAFMEVLDRIDRFDIGPDGELLLIGGDVTLMTARR